MAELSPVTPVRRSLVLDDAISASVAVPRFRTLLLLGLAVLAAALALVGVYGVVAYSVVQATREIGVRMALGAHAGGELRRVLSRGFRIGLLGVTVGLPVAWIGSSLLDAFLFDVSPTDP